MTQQEDIGGPDAVVSTAAETVSAVETAARQPVAQAQSGLAFLSKAGIENGQILFGNFSAKTESLTASIEASFSKASEGLTALNVKAVEALRENMNSTFELWQQMIGARTLMQVFELQSDHARKRVEVLGEQGQDLSVLAQRVAQDSLAPVRTNFWHNAG